MTKELSNESVVDILDMWRNALEKSKCIKRFKIENNLIDYDLFPDTEYNCNECDSPFCFKKLEWIDDNGEDQVGNIKLLHRKELEVERVLYG